MKRDLDLVKEILLQIEAAPTHLNDIKINITEQDPKLINFHLHLLLNAGYIEANVTDYGSVLPKRLTNSGCDFLDASRNNTIWNKAKDTAKEKGLSLTLDIAKELLITLTKASLGLH